MPGLTKLLYDSACGIITDETGRTLFEVIDHDAAVKLVSKDASPADYLDELLEEPRWVGIAGATYDLMWCSVIGTYHVFQYPRANKAGWHFVDDEGQPSTPCDSLEAGKLAAWSDYKRRLAPAFRKER